MNSVKYIGMDVHQATISIAVLDGEGKRVMELVVATRAAAILDFLQGLRGTLHVTFEEGTHSAWLYDLLVRRVARVVVSNPRRNALLKAGNKSDAIDARKLVAVYSRFYPLFQRAYRELGYPNKYFNDRLIEAIDDLLAAAKVSPAAEAEAEADRASSGPSAAAGRGTALRAPRTPASSRAPRCRARPQTPRSCSRRARASPPHRARRPSGDTGAGRGTGAAA